MNYRAFTLIELLVVIGIIAILSAVVFPVFASVRERGRQTACLSNQRQITMAVLQYVEDNDEHFPWSNSFDYNNHWSLNIDPYIQKVSQPESAIWHCPDSGTTHQSYSSNSQVI